MDQSKQILQIMAMALGLRGLRLSAFLVGVDLDLGGISLLLQRLLLMVFRRILVGFDRTFQDPSRWGFVAFCGFRRRFCEYLVAWIGRV